jgi:hypothetical protein
VDSQKNAIQHPQSFAAVVCAWCLVTSGCG